MTQIAQTPAAPDRARMPLPHGLEDAPEDGLPIGLVGHDGRVVRVARRLLEDLGFDGVDDLRGLPFAGLWPHAERPAVAAALKCARSGKTCELRLGLGYIQDCAGHCTVTVGPALADGMVRVRLSAGPAPDGPGEVPDPG